uniref:Uncharacterized protein n=1 Tax=Pinguiococcus pyrenoidosus TaxID=172671 RepID=A0A7R9Y9A0_9STRA
MEIILIAISRPEGSLCILQAILQCWKLRRSTTQCLDRLVLQIFELLNDFIFATLEIPGYLVIIQDAQVCYELNSVFRRLEFVIFHQQDNLVLERLGHVVQLV